LISPRWKPQNKQLSKLTREKVAAALFKKSQTDCLVPQSALQVKRVVKRPNVFQRQRT
jgi:hypothetical protein